MIESIHHEAHQSVGARIEEWNKKVATEIGCPITTKFWNACISELTTIKPGNVHCFADGHGMDVEHFLKSAYAAAGVLMNPELNLAQKIFQSVQATQQAVAINTNLGIILLCAPIVQACIALPNKTLRQSVQDEIEALDIDDARLIIDAIRLAAPSGLGKSKHYDVFEPVNSPIREIMAYAQDRDMIARQYASGYVDVFRFGFQTIDRLLQSNFTEGDLVTGVYLSFLSEYLDSHVSRQHGAAVAEEIQNEATELYFMFSETRPTNAISDHLLRVDMEWKQRDINPGTSADLTVATLFAHSITNAVN